MMSVQQAQYILTTTAPEPPVSPGALAPTGMEVTPFELLPGEQGASKQIDRGFHSRGPGTVTDLTNDLTQGTCMDFNTREGGQAAQASAIETDFTEPSEASTSSHQQASGEGSRTHRRQPPTGRCWFWKGKGNR